jgi:hypothetical protein
MGGPSAAEVPAAREAAAAGASVAGASAAVTRTLPRDIASFTGRGPELARLTGAVAGAAAGGVVGIYAIGDANDPNPTGGASDRDRLTVLPGATLLTSAVNFSHVESPSQA